MAHQRNKIRQLIGSQPLKQCQHIATAFSVYKVIGILYAFVDALIREQRADIEVLYKLLQRPLRDKRINRHIKQITVIRLL